jgi:hypothetical protein
VHVRVSGEDLGNGAAERERDDVGAQVEDDVELRAPLVVVPPRGAETDAEAAGLRFEGAAVRLQRVVIRLLRFHYEQVHPPREPRSPR